MLYQGAQTMRKKLICFAGFLLLIVLLVSEFASSFRAAKATERLNAPANAAPLPLPTLSGPKAIEHLKQEGLYGSLAEAMATVNPWVVSQAKLTASDGQIG